MVDTQASSSWSNLLYLDWAMLSFLLKNAKGGPLHPLLQDSSYVVVAGFYCYAELCRWKGMSQGCHV